MTYIPQDLKSLVPRYKWGSILPTKSDLHRGAGYQFYRIVPLDVMEISVGLGITDYTNQGVKDAIWNFDNCVARLIDEKVDHILLAGAPISAQLGRDRVLELLNDAHTRSGSTTDTPLEAVIASMKHLGIDKLAVGSRWDDELNDAVSRYFTSAGITITGITKRGQWAKQAFGMSFEEGLELALEVGREAAEFPETQAVYVAGGASMSLHVIPKLEEEFGIPYFTNMSAEVWNGLVRPGIIDPPLGWGKLLSGNI